MVDVVVLVPVEDGVACASFALGLVHRHVGELEDDFGDIVVGSGEGDADAGADAYVGCGERERCGQRHFDARREGLDL